MKTGRKFIPASPYYVFSEEKYISEKPLEYSQERLSILRAMPTVKDIFEFINGIIEVA